MTETEGDSQPDAQASAPRRKKRSRRILLGVIVAGSLYTSWQAVSIHTYGFRDDGRSADCAIVLGTAAWHYKPSPVFQERLNHAIELYKVGRVEAIVLTGGFGDNAPRAESQVAKTYCRDRGIPEEDLHLETKSQTTVENLTEAKTLLEQNGLQTALIVSDPWHLKRAVLIARRAGIDAYQSGTTTTRFQSFKSRASFILREFYLYHIFLVFGK